MAKLRVVRKNKNEKALHSYFAVKSKNEIYYQMASIFKQASGNKASLAEKIVMKSIMSRSPNISLENYI